MRWKIAGVMVVLLMTVLLWASADAAWYIGTAAGQSGSNPCNDGGPGTRLNPYCSFETAKTSMAGSADKTTYLRQGTYVRTTQYTFNAGENWATDPLDPPQSAIIDPTSGTHVRTMWCQGSGCHDISVRNITFNRASNNTSDPSNRGNIVVADGPFNVYIESNRFQGTTLYDYNCGGGCLAQYHLNLINVGNVYVRGNTFTDPAGLMGEAVYWTTSQSNTTFSNFYMTDNTFDGCHRWCAEIQSQATPNVTMQHFHLDRNTFTNYGGPNWCGGNGRYIGAISAVQNTADTNTGNNNTIWGNTFTNPVGYTGCTWSIEVNWNGATIANNISNYSGWTFEILFAPGTVLENNTVLVTTSGSGAADCGGAACAFSRDTSVYNHTEWIGTNTINGTNVTGCTTTGSPGFCAMAPQSYGTKPTTWAPSAPFGGGPATVPAAPANLRVVSP